MDPVCVAEVVVGCVDEINPAEGCAWGFIGVMADADVHRNTQPGDSVVAEAWGVGEWPSKKVTYCLMALLRHPQNW